MQTIVWPNQAGKLAEVGAAAELCLALMQEHDSQYLSIYSSAAMAGSDPQSVRML